MNQNAGEQNEIEEHEKTEPGPESGTEVIPAGKDPASPGDVPEGAQYGGHEPDPQG